MVVGVGTILVALIVFLVTYLLMRCRRPSDLPPGPTPLPVLGNLKLIWGKSLLDVAAALQKKYGDIFSLSIGPYWMVFINRYDALREVFVKHGNTFSDRPDVWYLREVKKKKGLAAGYPWKEQRAFTLNLLRGFGFGTRSMESIITEECEKFTELLAETQGKEFAISGVINKAVSNVICSIVLGKRFSYDDKEFDKFVKVITETVVNEYTPKVNILPVLLHIPKVKSRCDHCIEQNNLIRAWFQKQIDEHKETLKEDHWRDFIDAYLVQIKKMKRESDTQFTEENLKYVILDLFSGGTETTSSTIGWAVLCLVNHLEIQEKIRAEMLKNVSSGPPTLSDRNTLPYCEAVIHEVMRMEPILPMSISHTTSEDTVVNGYRIPKGAIVVPNLYSVMHDEKVFPDSHKFDPRRFLDSNGKFHAPEKFLPFSLGKRVCPGEALARNELFLFFTSLVWNFKILPPDGQPPPPVVGKLGVTYGPLPYKVRFVKYRD
ncbi:cytochrome P450 2J2-like [Mytilus trossulus]|uniref:cytochrome P450 2J2-like n=1 Tax=Mytilus trossulus TaxID=6551 RepID=UPI003006B8E0